MRKKKPKLNVCDSDGVTLIWTYPIGWIVNLNFYNIRVERVVDNRRSKLFTLITLENFPAFVCGRKFREGYANKTMDYFMGVLHANFNLRGYQGNYKLRVVERNVA
ncbi:MAG: hypothetical protein LBG64_04300 [Pseudomonadales bacterium]|jgi:hypothetical protein|nr:hypothetical protein [Pseudomonadales bacterium]